MGLMLLKNVDPRTLMLYNWKMFGQVSEIRQCGDILNHVYESNYKV